MEKTLIDKNRATLKDISLEKRPREKLFIYGVQSLSDSELLAIIIRTGYKENTAVDVAEDILDIDKSGLAYLNNITAEELMDIKGVGRCKAAQILATIEISKRLDDWKSGDKLLVNSPHIIADILMKDMKFLNKEHFKIVLLDIKNKIISIETISIGTLNASIVHPRDVFNVAIKKNANGLILVHNHPSGDTSPSKEDIDITKRIVKSGNILGIKVLDHIIIGDNRYLSFKEENMI